MKVLLASSGSGSRGGGEIFLNYLGAELAAQGHEILIWIPSGPRMDELASKCAQFARVVRSSYTNTYDYPLRSLSTLANSFVSKRVASEWRALEPDVIHVNKQNLEDGLDLLRAARLTGVPTTCTIHITQSARFLKARGAWLRDLIARYQLTRYPGTMVAVQEARRVELSEFLRGRGITETILNGVPIIDEAVIRSLRDAKRSELGLSDKDYLVIGVGRLVAQKRPFEFLNIARKLHKRIPAARFVWIGDGALRESWQKVIARERLENVVSCIGWQPDVVPYLAASDLLLHVPEFEGLPLALLEAMATSVPCAVTRKLTLEIPFLNEDNVLFVEDMDRVARK